jgi:hypothetical protein
MPYEKHLTAPTRRPGIEVEHGLERLSRSPPDRLSPKPRPAQQDDDLAGRPPMDERPPITVPVALVPD